MIPGSDHMCQTHILKFIQFCFLGALPRIRRGKQGWNKAPSASSMENPTFQDFRIPSHSQKIPGNDHKSRCAITHPPAGVTCWMTTVTAATKPKFHFWDKIPEPFPCSGAGVPAHIPIVGVWGHSRGADVQPSLDFILYCPKPQGKFLKKALG